MNSHKRFRMLRTNTSTATSTVLLTLFPLRLLPDDRM
jgi:hypothetical protein